MDPNILNKHNVHVSGNGTNFLVFSHSLGTDQSVWRKIVPYFEPTYQVALYDLVCANTVNTTHFDFSRYHDLDAYAQDLLDILDSLHVDRCYFVGHSLSAMIGIRAAIRRPEFFLKLILVGASPRFLNDLNYYGGLEVEDVDDVLKAMRRNYQAWVNRFAPSAVGANLPEDVSHFSRTLLNYRPDIIIFVSLFVFLYTDLRSELGRVQMPCCIIQTEREMAVPESVTTYLKEHLGGRTTLERMNVEGHLPHLTHPTLFTHHLTRALGQ